MSLIQNMNGLAVIKGSRELVSRVEGSRVFRAIVLDDEQIVRDLLIEMLRRLGVEGKGVETCGQAQEEMCKEFYHFAFFDYRLPGPQNGVECLLQARKLSPKTRWILWTGYADDERLQQMLSEFDFITLLRKPVRQEALQELIKSYNL